MSARSDLILKAERMITNPLLLCALVSGRARQLMIGGSAGRSTAEAVDYALAELLSGQIQFQPFGKNDRKREAKGRNEDLLSAARLALGWKQQDRPD
jgi:hypothetical protein